MLKVATVSGVTVSVIICNIRTLVCIKKDHN